MSVAAQKIRHTHTQSSNWTLTFPKVQSTFQQSSLFMKKLLAVAISSITYLRAIFPEKAFGNRHLDNLNLKILSENSVCPEACQVIEWVKGSFEAIDKKYLRQMMFGIYTNPGEPDNVIEAYTFRIIYTREGTTVTCNGETVASTSPCSSDLTRKDTISLLRTILILTQSLDPLPRNAYMSMKLLYYDEVTPADYEPKGFVPAETDNFFFKNEPVNLRMGNVSTPYHCLKVRIKTDKKQFVIVEEEPIPSGSLPVEESSRSDKSESSEVKLNDQELNSSKIGDASNAQELQNHAAYPENNQNEKNKNDKKVDVDDNIVKCPCGFLEDDGLMISCIKCETWQHATCFGILKENESPAKHICISCYVEDSQDFEPTDIHLYNLSPVDQQALCVWRRALMSCLDLKVVNATILARRLRIEKYVASSIMERLGREGYISNGTKKSHWKKNVNQEVIESTGISKYLRRETKDDITDNQIEELSKKTKNINIAGPTSYRFRGQKRAVSANSEEDQNFVFNSSQEVTADSIDGKRKRKKASTPETGIPVW